MHLSVFVQLKWYLGVATECIAQTECIAIENSK